MGLYNTTKELASLWIEKKKTDYQRTLQDVQTKVDSGGRVNEYSFQGQDIDFGKLRDVKEMRESGGLVAQLVHAKALMYFGTGVEISVPEEQEETIVTEDGQELTQVEWLNNHFGDLETSILNIGEDAIWYPYGAAEIKETRAGGFAGVVGIEPWTLQPETDETGEIIQWIQETRFGGNRQTERFDASEIKHFVINKRSSRDEIGISAVLRSEEEIEQYKENQRAMRNAIQMHGFPEWHISAGREGGAPLDDNELRRIIQLFEDRRSKGDTVTATGPDVELNRLDPGDIALDEVTSNDLQQLAISLGVPIEAVDFGSEGLGSGQQSKLRETILKLDILATQRAYTNQWVEKVIKPVLQRYSPFDHTVDVNLRLNDPMTGNEEMADLIQKVGDWMTANEAREKLDLEPKEELEDDFGPPSQGGEEAGGGIFGSEPSDTDFRSLQNVPDNAFPIQDRSECDGQVVTGPQGGLKCIPSGESGGEDGESTETKPPEETTVEDVAEALDESPEDFEEFNSSGLEEGDSIVVQSESGELAPVEVDTTLGDQLLVEDSEGNQITIADTGESFDGDFQAVANVTGDVEPGVAQAPEVEDSNETEEEPTQEEEETEEETTEPNEYGDLSEEAQEATSRIDEIIQSDQSDDEKLSDISSTVEETVGVETSFSGPVDNADNVAKEFVRLSDSDQLNNVEEIAYTDEPAQGIGGFSRLDKRVRISSNTLEDEDLAEWNEENKIGGDSPEWVVRHEVGHARHDEEMSVADRRNLDAAQFDSEEESEIQDNISDYAASQPTEFVAEAYAEKLSGDGSLPSFLDGTYDAFNGPEVPINE